MNYKALEDIIYHNGDCRRVVECYECPIPKQIDEYGVCGYVSILRFEGGKIEITNNNPTIKKLAEVELIKLKLNKI
jgi:hypothetical protein